MKEVYDVIILGCGPAGVSAALYAGRSNLRTLVIGGNESSLLKAEKIANYYGLQDAPTGKDLFDKGIKQLSELKLSRVDEEVINIEYMDDYRVETDKGSEYHARALIICTGAKRVKPNIAQLEKYEGFGVSYCAICDAFFYRQKNVCVLGSGAYALHEVKTLLQTAAKVTLLTNGEALSADFPEEVDILPYPIDSLIGNEALETVVFKNGDKLPVSGMFVALGVAGASDLARKLGTQVDGANIVTDENMATMLPGLFAAGDCTGGVLQVSTAVAEGAKAALSTIKYLRKQS